MPIDASLVNDGKGILFVGRDVVEGWELLAVKREFLNGPQRLEGRVYWLVDLSNVRELRMSINELSELIEIDRQLAVPMPDSMVAVVAAADSVYGFARMWEIKIESVGWLTSVFRSVADAKFWIESRLVLAASTSGGASDG